MTKYIKNSEFFHKILKEFGKIKFLFLKFTIFIEKMAKIWYNKEKQ